MLQASAPHGGARSLSDATVQQTATAGAVAALMRLLRRLLGEVDRRCLIVSGVALEVLVSHGELRARPKAVWELLDVGVVVLQGQVVTAASDRDSIFRSG